MSDPVHPQIPFYAARGIAPDSWLREPRFTAFRAGYAYAGASTNAISGLAKVSAEEAYYIWSLISRGMHRAGYDGAPDPDELEEGWGE